MTGVVGIVNLTPDSFSGDGTNTAAAMQQIEKMIDAGVVAVDIGAESTRPGAQSISPQEEWERLEPLLPSALEYCKAANVKVSIDTRHAATAKKSVELGADWINDVSGFDDPEMLAAVRDSACRLVVMHSLSVPADPDITLENDRGVVEELIAWSRNKIEMLESQGISRKRVIIDPGIGFGKNPGQSVDIIRNAGMLRDMIKSPLLIGHSRKSFLSLFTDKMAAQRDSPTMVVSLYLRRQNIDFLRVHNAELHREAFAVWDSLCSKK